MEDKHMDNLENFRERFEALEQQTEHLQHDTHALEAHPLAREAPAPMVERRRRAGRAVRLSVATLLGVIGIALGSVTPTHADVIQCGDVLGPGGRFELEHDLECDFRAVTVRDRAILDLNGHIVACQPTPGLRCVVLTGTGAQLLNGAVQGGFHESIVLEGTGGHTVRNVTSTLVDNNIIVQSDNNQLINVMAESIIHPAFNIAGNHNRLTGNIAHCLNLVFGNCIEVDGTENRLLDNFATSTTSLVADRGGFGIRGHNNVLRGNRSIGNEGLGIVVTGTGNSLTRNTALNNSTDLVDTHEDCDANRWRQNVFRTSRAGATENPACIQ
jgi:parallel beta-helix repeat protein